MQTTTNTAATPATSERDQILNLLETFIRSRPGLEFANYGDVSAYRSESRAITRDRDHALTLLRYVRWTSIDAAALREAFRDAYSGRLSLTPIFVQNASYYGLGTMDSAIGYRLDYCAGQYYPTEYRRAACAVLASAIWDYWREHCMPEPMPRHDTDRHDCYVWTDASGRGVIVSAGDWLRAKARAEFGRAIASRWFN